MSPSEHIGLPPLTLKEFLLRLRIVGGIVATFLLFAVLVLWLATPTITTN